MSTANGTLCRYFSAVAVAHAATGPLPHDICYGPEALEPVTTCYPIMSYILPHSTLFPVSSFPFYARTGPTHGRKFMRVINCLRDRDKRRYLQKNVRGPFARNSPVRPSSQSRAALVLINYASIRE